MIRQAALATEATTGGESGAGIEAKPLYRIDDDAGRRLPERASERDRLRQPEAVAGCGRETGRQRVAGEIEPADAPGRTGWLGCVNADRAIGASPVVQQ